MAELQADAYASGAAAGSSASCEVIVHGAAITTAGTGGVTLDQARAAVETVGVQRLEREFGA